MAAIPENQPAAASSRMSESSGSRRRSRLSMTPGGGADLLARALDSGARNCRPSLLLCPRIVQYERPSARPASEREARPAKELPQPIGHERGEIVGAGHRSWDITWDVQARDRGTRNLMGRRDSVASRLSDRLI